MLKETIIVRARNIILEELKKYTSNSNVRLYSLGTKTLADIGICNGITKLLDEAIQVLHPDICILSHDTITKFESDIDKYLDREFTVHSTVTGLPPKRKR